MTEQHHPHPADATVGDRGKPDDDAGPHGHDTGGLGDAGGRHHEAHAAVDEHGGEALGPIDVTAWGAAVLGIALGLVVLVALLLAVS